MRIFAFILCVAAYSGFTLIPIPAAETVVQWQAAIPTRTHIMTKIKEISDKRFLAVGGGTPYHLNLFSADGALVGEGSFDTDDQYLLIRAMDFVEIADGDFIVVGDGHYEEKGACPVMRISASLEKEWERIVDVKTYSNNGQAAVLTPSGHVAFAGYSTLLDMYDDGSLGLIDIHGNIMLTNRYDNSTEEEEGIRDDRFLDIENWNGGFVMAGISGYDFWIMAVDSAGAVLWDKTIGEEAVGSFEGAFDLEVLPDGGFVLGGYSKSPPGGTKTSPHYGGEDYWVVRLDGERNIVWQRSYGGTGDDRLVSLDVTEDGGFVLGGWSDSPVSGNKTAAHRGKKDYWVIRTDAQGEVLWEETYGGSEDDELVSIEQTSDGGYIIGGNSSSGADGNKTKPETGWWIIKLAAEGVARLSAPAQSAAEIAAEGFRLTLSGEPGTSYVLERSADLSEWTPISTNLLTESEMELRDPVPGAEMNFYRARTED